MKNIFCRGILSLVFLTTMGISAQTKPLKIGDPLPESLWTTPLDVVNNPQKTITLADSKDKLVLIDFWATWCSGCLLSFPKMEELQKKFGSKIKILSVSNESRAVLEKFFATKNGQRYKTTVSVSGDKLFHGLFPHRGVPFIVWLKDGKVLNTTDAEQVTEQTIKEVLDNEKSSLQTVVQLERNRPLMLSEAFDRERGLEMQNYSLLVKGRIRSIGFGTWFHSSGDTVYGRQFTNLSLLEILRTITSEIFTQNKESFNNNKIIVESKKPELLDYITTKDGKREDYNRYSYEYIVPVAKADSLYPMMLKNINQFIDYTAAIEPRKVKCFVLKRTSDKDKLATKGGELKYLLTEKETSLQNTEIINFISGMSGLPFITQPIVDETGYKGNIDLQMGTITDLATLRKALSLYDLELTEAQRTLNMLVIRDKVISTTKHPAL